MVAPRWTQTELEQFPDTHLIEIANQLGILRSALIKSILSADKSKKKGKAPVADKAAPDLPASLNHRRFIEALGQFVEHRKLLRKPMTDLAIKMLIKRCAKYSPEVGAELLELSIERGWLGVVPEALPAALAQLPHEPAGLSGMPAAIEAAAPAPTTAELARRMHEAGELTISPDEFIQAIEQAHGH